MSETEQSSFARRYAQEQEFRSRYEMEHELPKPGIQPSSLKDLPLGFMEGLGNLGLGVTQRAMELTGNPKAGFIAQQVAAGRKRAEEEAKTKGQPPILRGLGQFAGEAAPAVGASFLAGPSIPAGMLVGGLTGAARPTASPEEAVVNTALGAGAAGVTSLATRAFMPRPLIEPEHLAAIRAGKGAGFRYTGGQISDDPITQRAEAHALWNPFTKRHAIPFSRKQDDAYVTGLLKEAGVPESSIAKNPALDPQTLGSARQAISNRFDAIFKGQEADLSPKAHPDVWRSIINANRAQLVKEDAAIVRDVTSQVNRIASQGKIPSELLQDTLELVDETAKNLSAKGSKRAADALKDLHKSLVGAVKDPDAYRDAKADWSRLLTIEDTLRRSAKIGEGIPDKAKLAGAIERYLPGGVLYNKSSMADLARGGLAAKGVGALPERSTALPMPQDIPNAFTYWRYNNPAAKFGLLNPIERDLIEMGIREIPGVGLLQAEGR